MGLVYATTISNITDVAVEDIHQWQQRPLKKRYSVLYLDGMYIKLRRDVVDNEVICFSVGVFATAYNKLQEMFEERYGC